MTILNQILEKLELDTSGSMSDEAAWIKSLIARQPQPEPTPISKVDVVKKLEQLGAGTDLDWKKSIVDLLKLLKIDSSLKTRKELAKELGCLAELMNDPDKIKMNIWLHKTVLRRIAENGGNIPQELISGEISITQSKYYQTIEITINGKPDLESNYITWAPVPSQIRLADREGVTRPVTVRLRNQNPGRGGQVVFFAAVPGPGKKDHGQDELELRLPVDGSPVSFFIAGKFGKPSIEDKDAIIEVIESSTGNVISTTPLMVRIRKNANNLTDNERDRFLSALALLHLASLVEGLGGFGDFANIHTSDGSPEAHGNVGFLPWHRAFMLDLERELQALDPSVTLPYWRFDKAAPNLFTKEFMGIPNANDTVEFSTNNPLQFLSPGIVRRPGFDTTLQPASVSSEETTLNLGDSYSSFVTLEWDPHGAAHVSFMGTISNIGTAAQDPLFFLLHANVDRLWAKWQWLKHRFDPAILDSYSFLGSAGDPGSTRIGHNLKDTMWPWNQVTGDLGMENPRPPTAPGGNFPRSKIMDFPGLTPAVADMIDYQGGWNHARLLGFDYDDVPFEFDAF